MFKANNRDTRDVIDVVLVSLLLTLNTFSATQLTFTSSKLIPETLEKYVTYVQS